MVSFPLRVKVEVAYPQHTTPDRFGDAQQVFGEYQTLSVIGWSVDSVDESTGDSLQRTVTKLTLYSPKPIPAGARLRLPDGGVWLVQGESEDYTNGPFWDPGAFVVHARKTEG